MLFLRQLMSTWGIVHLLLSMIDVTTSDELLELACNELDEDACYQFFHTRMASWCSNGLCYCRDPDNNHEVSCRPMELLMSNVVGGVCPCTQPMSFCDPEENVCYCKDNHMPTKDLRRCIPVSVALGEPCELDIQCRHYGEPYVECHDIDRNCTCKSGYIAHEGHCLPRLDRTCERDKECHECGTSVCARDHLRPERLQCACSHNYARMFKISKCILAPDYNDTCTYDSMCQVLLGEGGFCNGRRCDCKDEYYIVHKKEGFEVAPAVRGQWSYHLTYRCLPEPVYGAYCRNHTDCEKEGVPKSKQLMECIYGECVCVAGYKSMDNIHCEVDVRDDTDTGTTIVGKMLGIQALIVSLSLLVFTLNFL